MRINIRHIILVFVAALNLPSCIDEPIVYEPDRRIAFNAIVDVASKANNEAVLYPEDVPFRLWAYELPDAQKWQGNEMSAISMISGDKVVYNGNDWSTASDYLWPTRPNQLSFFAYSPAEAVALFTKEDGVMFKNFNALYNGDFLCSLPITDASKPDTDALTDIVFKSPLCDVEFYAYASAEEGTQIWIEGLLLNNVSCVGTFTSLPQWNWDELSGEREIDVYQGELLLEETPLILGMRTLIIPQELKPVIRYSYKTTSSEAVIQMEVALDMQEAEKLVAGKKREYIIKVTPEYVKVQNPK